eukprot:1812517-Amphidinium_carterae.1
MWIVSRTRRSTSQRRRTVSRQLGQEQGFLEHQKRTRQVGGVHKVWATARLASTRKGFFSAQADGEPTSEERRRGDSGPSQEVFGAPRKNSPGRVCDAPRRVNFLVYQKGTRRIA